MTTRREIEKSAKKAGFSPTDKGKGSYTLWQHPDGRTLLIGLCKMIMKYTYLALVEEDVEQGRYSI